MMGTRIDWMFCDEMRARGISVYDARGQKVSRVRWCAPGDGGVHVKVIPFVDVPPHKYPAEYPADMTLAQVGAIDADDNVVEAEMFIKGGVIRERTPSEPKSSRPER